VLFVLVRNTFGNWFGGKFRKNDHPQKKKINSITLQITPATMMRANRKQIAIANVSRLLEEIRKAALVERTPRRRARLVPEKLTPNSG